MAQKVKAAHFLLPALTKSIKLVVETSYPCLMWGGQSNRFEFSGIGRFNRENIETVKTSNQTIRPNVYLINGTSDYRYVWSNVWLLVLTVLTEFRKSQLNSIGNKNGKITVIHHYGEKINRIQYRLLQLHICSNTCRLIDYAMKYF